VTELERLEKEFVGKWFVWYKKNNKNPFYARFSELGYMLNGIYYNPRTKRFSRFKISDIYQLRGFTRANDEEIKDIKRVYGR
jgi:hypothetical protein